MKSLGLCMDPTQGLNIYILIYREKVKTIFLTKCYTKWDNI